MKQTYVQLLNYKKKNKREEGKKGEGRERIFQYENRKNIHIWKKKWNKIRA